MQRMSCPSIEGVPVVLFLFLLEHFVTHPLEESLQRPWTSRAFSSRRRCPHRYAFAHALPAEYPFCSFSRRTKRDDVDRRHLSSSCRASPSSSPTPGSAFWHVFLPPACLLTYNLIPPPAFQRFPTSPHPTAIRSEHAHPARTQTRPDPSAVTGAGDGQDAAGDSLHDFESSGLDPRIWAATARLSRSSSVAHRRSHAPKALPRLTAACVLHVLVCSLSGSCSRSSPPIGKGHW
ncbi:hypothetical protein FB45DRAFT_298334 [Roridomyces roridus]|uniref:Uncharacterized protein n=1 Tax=Roridomyces roridus TaxID=1738132 RepID=A0AAD7CC88_9AGAR|nr:hypothetical protein FB45DRAFT_298334 [Roridomyces roridus]